MLNFVVTIFNYSTASERSWVLESLPNIEHDEDIFNAVEMEDRLPIETYERIMKLMLRVMLRDSEAALQMAKFLPQTNCNLNFFSFLK